MNGFTTKDTMDAKTISASGSPFVSLVCSVMGVRSVSIRRGAV